MHQLMLANLEESQKLATRFAFYVKPKQCYDNVAMVVLSSVDLSADYPGIQVAFGGVQIFPDNPANQHLYTRHAFFVYNGHVLDPTLALQEKLKATTHFVPVMELNLPSYRDLLSTHEETSPPFVMEELDKARATLMQENIFLMG